MDKYNIYKYILNGLYNRKEGKSQINNLSCPLKNFKKKQNKTKARRNNKTEVSENENRKRIKIMKEKWKISKINKNLAILRKNREKTKITSIRNEQGISIRLCRHLKFNR